jgi:Spy/CpxP family protein refolding chaperone
VTRARLKAYALVAGVFLLGFVAGGSASYAYAQAETRTLFTGDRQAFEQLRLQALERELDLDAAQIAKIRTIFEQHRAERERVGKQMFESCGEPVRNLRARIDGEIEAVLRPEQVTRYAAIKLRMPGPR